MYWLSLAYPQLSIVIPRSDSASRLKRMITYWEFRSSVGVVSVTSYRKIERVTRRMLKPACDGCPT
jgi:hypothetical protein